MFFLTGTFHTNIFQKLGIPRNLLPRGCYSILLTSCKDGGDLEIRMSSISPWYSPRSDLNTITTNGTVFVEANNLAVPISISGLEIKMHHNDFTLNLHGHNYIDVIEANQKVANENCIRANLSVSDLFQFSSAGSFIKSVFNALFVILPSWIHFSAPVNNTLSIQDLHTDLVYGKDIDTIDWCAGAPVLPDHLYSIFRFGTDFRFSFYNTTVFMPKLLRGEKMCLIIDICQNLGGSFFLLFPKESRTFLTKLDIFQKLFSKQELRIFPKGIGLSFNKGIGVRHRSNDLELWNGDSFFHYKG